MPSVIPNLDQYSGDPLIYKDSPDPGKMRHTFTGLRPTFPNIEVHYVITKRILPLRLIVAQQGRGVDDGTVPMTLVTTMHEGLDSITKTLKDCTFDGQAVQSTQTLAQRRDAQAAFVKKASDRSCTVEQMAAELGSSFADSLLQPAGAGLLSLSFDFVGNDPNYPQPTPARFPNASLRMFLIGLDLITVFLSTMNSASERRSINAYDNALLQSMFADLYKMCTWAGTPVQPYNPSGTLPNQLDGVWNADGEFDPLLTDGGGQRGDQKTPGTAQAGGNAAGR